MNEEKDYKEKLCNLKITLSSVESLQKKVETIHQATSPLYFQDVPEETNATQILQSAPLLNDAIQILDTYVSEQECSLFCSEIDNIDVSCLSASEGKKASCDNIGASSNDIADFKKTSCNKIGASSNDMVDKSEQMDDFCPRFVQQSVMSAAISCDGNACPGTDIYMPHKVPESVEGAVNGHDHSYTFNRQHQKRFEKPLVLTEINEFRSKMGLALLEHPSTDEVEHDETDLNLEIQSSTLKENVDIWTRKKELLQNASINAQTTASKQAHSVPECCDIYDKSSVIQQQQIRTGKTRTKCGEGMEDTLIPTSDYNVSDQDNMTITDGQKSSNTECCNEMNKLHENMEIGHRDDDKSPLSMDAKDRNMAVESGFSVNHEPKVSSTSNKTHSILIRLERPVSSLNTACKQSPVSNHTETTVLSSVLYEQEAAPLVPNVAIKLVPDTIKDGNLLKQLVPDVVELHIEDCKYKSATDSITVKPLPAMDLASLPFVRQENTSMTDALGCESSTIMKSCSSLPGPAFQDCEMGIELSKERLLNLENCLPREPHTSDEATKFLNVSKGDQHVHKDHPYPFNESELSCLQNVNVKINNLITEKFRFDDANVKFYHDDDISDQNGPVDELRSLTASSTLSLVESSSSPTMLSAVSFQRKFAVSPSMQKRCICEQPPYGYMMKCRLCKYEYHAASVLNDNASGDNYVCENCKCLPNSKRRRRENSAKS